MSNATRACIAIGRTGGAMSLALTAISRIS